MFKKNGIVYSGNVSDVTQVLDLSTLCSVWERSISKRAQACLDQYDFEDPENPNVPKSHYETKLKPFWDECVEPALKAFANFRDRSPLASIMTFSAQQEVKGSRLWHIDSACSDERKYGVSGVFTAISHGGSGGHFEYLDSIGAKGIEVGGRSSNSICDETKIDLTLIKSLPHGHAAYFYGGNYKDGINSSPGLIHRGRLPISGIRWLVLMT